MYDGCRELIDDMECVMNDVVGGVELRNYA